MSRVTAPSQSANNSKTLFFVNSLAYTSVITHYYMCMSSMEDQSTNYKSNWHMKAYSKWYYAKPGVVSFEQMVKLSMNLDFPNGNFWPSIKTRLLKFPSAYRNSFQGCIFLKEINH